MAGVKGSRGTDEQRFERYTSPEPMSGCLLWTGGMTTGGYGVFFADGRRWTSHRWAYIHWIGPIPDGLDLDHLCRVRGCANTLHLEPVTRAENLRRGEGRAFRIERTNECGKKHGASMIFVLADGRRRCRQCEREHEARRRPRRKP